MAFHRYCQVAIKYLFFLGLFLSPFVYWPKALVPFEIPKVNFVQRWIEILIILGFFTKIKNRKFEKNIFFLTSFFIISITLASFFGTDLKQSLFGNYFRADGLITYFHLYAFFLFVITFWDISWWKTTQLMIVSSSILIGFLTIILRIFPSLQKILYLQDWNLSFGATFGQPNFLAGFLLVSFPFTHFFIVDNKNKIIKKLYFAVLLIVELTIILTRANAGIIGFALFYFLLLVLHYLKPIRNHIKHGLRSLTLSFILFILITINFLPAIINKYQEKASYYPIFHPESRVRIIVNGLIGFSKRPILGYGWANFDKAFIAGNWPKILEKDVYIDKAHSHLLEILTTTGIIGFTIYLLLITKTIHYLIKKQHQKKPIAKVLLISLLLFLFHSQTNIISINEELIFWLILGFSARL